MSQDPIDILKRALQREKGARKAAEKILEDKSKALYITSQELKKSNSKLANLLYEKSTELKGVFENIIDAYVVMDTKGNIVKINDAAIELFGYDLVKENVNALNLIYKEDFKYAMSSFNNLINKGFFTNYRARVYTKPNTVKWVHINASVIFNSKNKPIAAQGIVRDITDIKKLEEQKENLLAELEKSNNELQEYAHIVSHDLKSPLRSINALISWLKEDNVGNLDEVSLQNFGHIETTLEKMEQLITDILNYSSIGKANNIKEKVDLNILITELVHILYIPEHILVNIKNKLPVVNGEEVKLKQLFQNLISNSVKFMDKEKGIIEIDVEEQKSFFKISIKDNGMGIEEKYHDKIFKIFHSLNKRKDSTGIGLSIVKKIAKLHGGEVWLESKYGEGTTFYITLKK